VFLGIVYTNFIFEKLLSHETQMAGRVTATNNKQTQLLRKVAINETTCSSDKQHVQLKPSSDFTLLRYWLQNLVYKSCVHIRCGSYPILERLVDVLYVADKLKG